MFNQLFVKSVLAVMLSTAFVASMPMDSDKHVGNAPRDDPLTQFPSDPPNPITTNFIDPSQFASSFLNPGPQPTGTPSSCTRVARSNLFVRGYTPSKGDTFCFGKTTVTLQKQIGTNSEGSTFVWQLENQNDYLIKIFSEADEEDVQDEATNYKQAQELNPLGIDLNGRAFMIKWVQGQEIKDTNSYKAASDKDKFLDETAAPLVLTDLQHFACDFGILHKDLHAGNILFEESGTDLTQANLIDWGVADANFKLDCNNQDALKKFQDQQLVLIKKGLRS